MGPHNGFPCTLRAYEFRKKKIGIKSVLKTRNNPTNRSICGRLSPIFPLPIAKNPSIASGIVA